VLTGNILITGGSGTLGHAIIRTAIHEDWDCTFTIYSRSELRQAQTRAKYPRLRYILGDVRDYDRLAAAIAGHSMVIHAAAMKRIPECEAQPSECYATNIQGSANVAYACILAGVERCIGISTDKACRAVTAYGASKLAMEKIFQAQPEGATIFTAVRYGNVVASNGSVIPIWREQARQGKSLTITNPDMTRFWLAPSDAVQLIKSAATLEHGMVLVPAALSLSIAEMAEIVAPGAPCSVTGLRSVEKEHEDLIHSDEPTCTAKNRESFVVVPEHHPHGARGASYTSDRAPRLSQDAFLAMLEEAATYD
jgi:UDP-N-acetylglucosamine 4,6-dehydratase/5-epimerase